jgi:superoxide dismutase, Cu-Zn family
MRLLQTTFLLSAIALAACTSMGSKPSASGTATLQPTKGYNATGTVQFEQFEDKVVVSGQISGLKPNGEHGFHVHDKGDCSSGDGMSAGPHFNPEAKPHGGHHGHEPLHHEHHHHAGDLPSVKADAQGVANFRFETTSLTVGKGSTNVIGRGLVLHRDPDDMTSQPAGNSGPRVACGVIG